MHWWNPDIEYSSQYYREYVDPCGELKIKFLDTENIHMYLSRV